MTSGYLRVLPFLVPVLRCALDHWCVVMGLVEILARTPDGACSSGGHMSVTPNKLVMMHVLVVKNRFLLVCLSVHLCKLHQLIIIDIIDFSHLGSWLPEPRRASSSCSCE